MNQYLEDGLHIVLIVKMMLLMTLRNDQEK